MAGLLIGSLLSGSLADKFGRKKTGLATLLLCGLSQMAGSFAKSYYWYILSQFMAAIGNFQRNQLPIRKKEFSRDVYPFSYSSHLYFEAHLECSYALM